ncbi:MAG: beta-lactamase family protein [Oscillospiraceae bacterium]|nr:beta-lactamase family protein [Oscillospiraceae bacterium]
MKKLLTILLLLALLLAAVPTAAITQTTISSEAEEHILNELNRANIPNAAIAVIQDGETSYILKDSEQDTLFQIGSTAKSFTGFGVLLLEDMGLLSISDPVNQHLPWFEVRYNGEPVPHEDISIYNLLQHTSGFTSDDRRFPSTSEELSKDELIGQLTGIEFAFYPSEGHIYGNVNYVILGVLIEAVSGQSYDDFMTQNVLHPLGLYDTFTNAQRAHDTGRVIGGHRFGFLRPRPHNVQATSSLAMQAGGMYSSISDMARWAGIQLGVIEVNEQFTRIVQRSRENNHTSQNPFADLGFVYAAGWGVSQDGWGILEYGSIQHSGGTFGYFAYVEIVPERDMALVILSNFRHMNLPQWISLVWDAVDGRSFNRIGLDTYGIVDIVFVILTAVGILFIGLFVRLAVKLRKQLHSGEKVNPKLRIRWLIGPILSIMGLIIIYFIVPMLFQISFSSLLLLLSSSMTTAIIAVWIMAAYSLFSLWAKVFANPRVGK